MSTVTNRPKQRKVTDFVDRQVATLIKDHAGEELCIEDLVNAAEKEMPTFDWTKDKIRHSVTRLEKKGLVTSKHVIRSKKLCRVPSLIQKSPQAEGPGSQDAGCSIGLQRKHARGAPAA
jgi:hypothetical protein